MGREGDRSLMGRPRTIVGWVLRLLSLAITVMVGVFLIVIAIRLVGNFVSPDSGDAPGNAGHLFVAAFFLVLAGPFVALTLAMGLPLVSDNPRFRGAAR